MHSNCPSSSDPIALVEGKAPCIPLCGDGCRELHLQPDSLMSSVVYGKSTRWFNSAPIACPATPCGRRPRNYLGAELL